MQMRTRGRKKLVWILSGSKPQKADSRKRTAGKSPTVHLAPTVLRQSARECRFYACCGRIYRSTTGQIPQHSLTDIVQWSTKFAYSLTEMCRFACGLLTND